MKLVCLLVLISSVGAASAFKEEDLANALSDTTDGLITFLGWEKEKVSMSTSSMYIREGYFYDIEVESTILSLPIKYADGIETWRDLQFPLAANAPFLPPFPLVGPVELRMEDANDLRLAVPHDVEVGELDRVFIADGTTVTVTGAREISLETPLMLTVSQSTEADDPDKHPWPMVGGETRKDVAQELVDVSKQLREAAKSHVMSFRLVRPVSLVSAHPALQAPERLKVKKTSPGTIEITKPTPEVKASEGGQAWLWPLRSVKSSNNILVDLERKLKEFLPELVTDDEGSLKMIKAKAGAVTFVKIEFELRRTMDESNIWSTWPQSQTKPTVHRKHYELVIKVENDDSLALWSLTDMYPYLSEPTPLGWSSVSYGDTTNTTLLFKHSPFFFPSSPSTL